jgi:hypothetical protein
VSVQSADLAVQLEQLSFKMSLGDTHTTEGGGGAAGGTANS